MRSEVPRNLLPPSPRLDTLARPVMCAGAVRERSELEMRIHDAFDIPTITALDEFIARLDDTEERVKKNLSEFVLPDDVFKKVDAMLIDIGQRMAQGRDTGRFIYGTFGSGKSHLLTVLGKMFEQDETVYAVGDPALGKLRGAHAFLDKGKALVVRINMMDKESLVQALYEGYNAALPGGIEPIGFTDEKQIFELIEEDAQRHYGSLDALIEQCVEEEAFRDASFYHRKRHGTLKEQMDLAARLLTWRNHGKKIVREKDLWVSAADGFARIADHAKAHGYSKIVWLVDELVIWIRGKSRQEYIQQINDLSALVDHDSKRSRSVPFLVLVAVQQDIAETCPDDLSEKGFREQLGFVSDRFKPHLTLEDQDLYEVTARRVLKKRPEKAAEFNAAVEEMFKKHGPAIKELSGDLDPALVRRLYPFHPALLRALVDVTQALSRNRTAMAALYGLLGKYPALEVGKFLPLGALFDILFTSDNVETVRKRGQSQIALRFVAAFDTYERLVGKIDDAVKSVAGAKPEELHQLVRTVLLCQLSDKPYFHNGQSLHERVTASTLLRLNQSDVAAMTERTGVSKVVNLFRALAANDAQVQVTGEQTDPLVTIKTERVDIEKVLARARGDLVHADRFRYCLKLLDAELGLGLDSGTSATLSVTWRGTRRKGQVRLANVRTLSYAGQENDFDPGTHEFLILVDYPFDEQSGSGRQDDVTAVQRARQRKRSWTVAWLPEHFTETERKALDNAAAIERIRASRRHYVDNDYAPREAHAIASALEAFYQGQHETLKAAIGRLYFEQGIVEGCSDLLDNLTVVGRDRGKALEGLALSMLDNRYPQHPHFKRRVQVKELEKLSDWVAKASQTGQPVDLKTSEMDIVTAFGVPLEMVYAGEASISRRIDGRFLTAVRDWIAREPVRFRASALREKLMAGGKDGFGFSDEVVRFFLYYLLQVEGYEARGKDNQPLTFEGLSGLPLEFELVKADVVDAPTWDRARSVARRLLDVEKTGELPSPPEQVKLSQEVQKATKRLRGSVETLQDHLRRTMGWAKVETSSSDRAMTIGKLIEVLKQILDTVDPAQRARILAAVDKDPAMPAWKELADIVDEELRAIQKIEAHKRAFEHIQKQGSEAQKHDVVLALQNLLREPVSRRLSLNAHLWTEKADRIFGELLNQPQQGLPLGNTEPRPTPVPPDGGKKKPSGKYPVAGGSGRGEPIKKSQQDVTRERLREALLAMVDDVVQRAEGERFDVEVVVTARGGKS